MIPDELDVRRRWLVPEVIQTSAMDCGPAALKAMLGGFGIHLDFGRLREACQTDLDGSSIDTLEETAAGFGLAAEQVMIPADHLLLPEAQALPALAVVHRASGVTHFLVIWRCHGSRVQIMDPATGRRWPGRERLLEELYLHTMPVAANDWRQWAGSPDFLEPLGVRVRALGLSRTRIAELLAESDR